MWGITYNLAIVFCCGFVGWGGGMCLAVTLGIACLIDLIKLGSINSGISLLAISVVFESVLSICDCLDHRLRCYVTTLSLS